MRTGCKTPLAPPASHLVVFKTLFLVMKDVFASEEKKKPGRSEEKLGDQLVIQRCERGCCHAENASTPSILLW